MTGGFAPIFTEAIDRLYESTYPDRARQCENVLRRLAEHSDTYGMCWPGIRKIMERSHYSEGTVKRSLAMLAELDYIRIHVEHSRARRKAQVTWQISPLVLYVREDFLFYAHELWRDGEKYRNEMFNEQPDSEPESEPEPEPAPVTRPRTTTTTRTERKKRKAEPIPHQGEARPVGEANAPDDSQSESSEPQSAKRSTRAKPGNQKTPPGSAPPPPSIAICRKPLVSTSAESLAQRLAQELSTRLPQARQLIVQFDTQNVEMAYAWLRTEMREGREVKSPFGLMKWWLEQNVIVDAPPDSGADYSRFVHT